MASDVLFPPGPQKSLLLGNAPQLQQNPLEFMLSSARTYGEIVHFRFGPTHGYLLSNPAYAHYVLVERPDKFSDKTRLIRSINSAFGHDLFPPKDEIRKTDRRRTLFETPWLEDFADEMTQGAQALAATWADGEPRDMVSDLKRLTLGLMARVLLGSTATEIVSRMSASMAVSRHPGRRGFEAPLPVPTWIPTRANLRRQQAETELNGVMTQLIAECRAGQCEHNVLASLLASAESRGPVTSSEQQVRDEAVSLFFAGHETAAHTLAWAVYLLAQNPDAEAALQAELDTVLHDRVPTRADLDRLSYTEMVLRETLRLYPPAWLLTRQARSEIRIASYYLPSGSLVYVSPYIIHRSPRYFVNPEAFIPERFAEGYERRMPRYAYMPFGTGSAAQVDEAVVLTTGKLILATLLQRHRLALVPGCTAAPDPQAGLRPTSGIVVRAERREQASVASAAHSA